MSRPMRGYDVSAEETLTGVLQDVRHTNATSGMPGMRWVYLMVKTDQETTRVLVGPAWFLADQRIFMQAGESVSVTGVRVSRGGAGAVVARQLRIGEQHLTLRDGQGMPLWRGARWWDDD